MKNRFQWVGSETKPVTTDLHITIKQIIQISHTYKNNLSHNSVMFLGIPTLGTLADGFSLLYVLCCSAWHTQLCIFNL